MLAFIIDKLKAGPVLLWESTTSQEILERLKKLRPELIIDARDVPNERRVKLNELTAEFEGNEYYKALIMDEKSMRGVDYHSALKSVPMQAICALPIESDSILV